MISHSRETGASMQTDYLRYFIDVAMLGSMSSAAKKNYMSPQGISRSISALESELGCELFQRDSNKVTLTRFGERLLDDARNLIESENNIRRSVLELNSEELKKHKMHFTCYMSPIFSDTPLFFPVSGLNTALYGKVQFLQRGTTEVVELLIEAAGISQPGIITVGGLGLFDLFTDENVQLVQRLIDVGYEYHPFMHTTDYVLVPAYSTLAKAKSLSKAEIRQHNLAVGANGGMERAIARHIGIDNIYVSSNDSGHRSHLCRMGEVLTFIPGTALVFDEPEGTVAVPMQEPYTIEIGFAARRSAFQEGVLADVLERLYEFYSRHQQREAFKLLDGSLSSSLFAPKKR